MDVLSLAEAGDIGTGFVLMVVGMGAVFVTLIGLMGVVLGLRTLVGQPGASGVGGASGVAGATGGESAPQAEVTPELVAVLTAAATAAAGHEVRITSIDSEEPMTPEVIAAITAAATAAAGRPVQVTRIEPAMDPSPGLVAVLTAAATAATGRAVRVTGVSGWMGTNRWIAAGRKSLMRSHRPGWR